MKAATKWLGKSSTDVLTQETQKDAVEKLDAIIAELEKQIEQGRAGRASANPSRPMQDSMIKAGPGGMNADGSQRETVVTGNLNVAVYPTWTSDGKQITYGAPDDKKQVQLIQVNLDGSGTTTLTHEPSFALGVG